jgi:hypothetical protein
MTQLYMCVTSAHPSVVKSLTHAYVRLVHVCEVAIGWFASDDAHTCRGGRCAVVNIDASLPVTVPSRYDVYTRVIVAQLVLYITTPRIRC